MSKLKIDDIVDVVVTTQGKATPREAFNVGLIVGVSSHINVTDRCKVYSGVDRMIDDGFLITDPEYLAADLYFKQSPTPTKVVVGVKDTSDGSTETWVQAITACRQKNGEWYGVYVASATALSTADHQAIATYVQTLRAAYFYDDSAAADITNVTTDVFSVLKGLAAKRSYGLYSTTKYAGAAAMGFAMGANDGRPGSAYTMAYKSLEGVTPDDLDKTSVENLKDKNANYYVTRGASYNVMENGVTADGTWFDEVIGTDQLANDIQIACMDVLTQTSTKIPYTDAGALQFVVAINGACADAALRGFLAPGIWNGPTVLDLETGDTLEAGYLVQAEPVADQPASAREDRICPPIYVCGNKAGAIHQVTIKVNI